MTNGPSDDAPLHIATPLVAGDDAVAHQKSGGADVVGDDPQRAVVQVLEAYFAGRCFDQGVEQVDFIVAVHMLQDRCQALQAHAGVHAGCGQFFERTIGLHVELHEHMVPNFDVTVAIFFRAAGRAAGHFGAVVVKNLRARAAGPCIGHHPKVVGGVLGAFVVTNAHDALGWYANLLVPNVVGLVVIDVDRDPEFFRRQFVDLGQQFPAPFQAVALEVVAKRPIAQHLEKSVVPRCVTHVLQIVVLAARPQTGLHRGRAHIRTLVLAQKHVLELHHARVGEHERGVVAGNEGTGGHHGVGAGCVKVQKALPYVGDRKTGRGHERGDIRSGRHRSEYSANSHQIIGLRPGTAL